MQTVYGNLLEMADHGAFDVIVHGCNTKGVMGAGIARQIAEKYPQALVADRGSLYIPDRLGNFTVAEAQNRYGDKFLIVNAYTQEDFRRNHGRINADYNAIENVFKLIYENFGDRRIGYPMIGAGLAHGDWNVISAIIDAQLRNADHTLVKLPTPDQNQSWNFGSDFNNRF